MRHRDPAQPWGWPERGAALPGWALCSHRLSQGSAFARPQHSHELQHGAELCTQPPTGSLHPASCRHAGWVLPGCPETPQSQPRPSRYRRRRPVADGSEGTPAPGRAVAAAPFAPGMGLRTAEGTGRPRGAFGIGGTGSHVPAPVAAGAGLSPAGKVPRAERWLAAAAMRLIASN